MIARIITSAMLTLALSGAALAESVLMKTNMGDITISLNNKAAPKTVENFLAYVDSGFYDGTVFHRVIEGFMIQGGGFTQDMDKKDTRDPIKNEADNGLVNDRGSIAMARTSRPHSATAQFFINHKYNSFLDYPGQDGWGYAVFGRVTKGLDVVDKIADVKTGRKNGMRDVPRSPVIIESVTRIK